MGQVQCPNCGGYKVSTTVKQLYRQTGREVPTFGCIGWGITVFLALAFILGITQTIQTGPSTPLSGTEIPICSTILCGALILLFVATRIKVAMADKIDKYYHECTLCGYQWARRADEPMPDVTVDPDLIAKGEQRLEEERRRVNEQAAAALFLEQQRKK